MKSAAETLGAEGAVMLIIDEIDVAGGQLDHEGEFVFSGPVIEHPERGGLIFVGDGWCPIESTN